MAAKPTRQTYASAPRIGAFDANDAGMPGRTLERPQIVVRERLPDGFALRELAAQSLRGRQAAVHLYAVDGVADGRV